MKLFYVYILSNQNGMLYTGVTSNLEERVLEHKQKRFKGYTQKYAIDRLVYYEEFEVSLEAIEREKQIKKWRRSKKIALIKGLNPAFEDLSLDWFED